MERQLTNRIETPAQEICGRLVHSRRPVRIDWADGKIIGVHPARFAAAEDRWIAPPLLDLQINGFAGIDFQQDDLQREQLLYAAGELRAAGCARFLVTLVTDEWTRLLNRLARLRRLRNATPELAEAIAGWHIEGPFLSAEPGYAGAHNREVMCDPTAAHIKVLRDVAGSDPLLLTLAPERRGALAAIQLAVSLGIKVSLGHTNASADILKAAVAAGATGFTHLGNACPQTLDRHDNIVWRVLDTPGLMVSLIPDRIHVSPALFRLVHRVLAPEQIYYTTDAIAPAGSGPGRYQVGRLVVDVAEDGIARQPGQSNYAGSTASPLQAVFRAATMLNRSWMQVWDFLSSRPARLMGWSHELRVGSEATFCSFRWSPGTTAHDLKVIVRGQPASSS